MSQDDLPAAVATRIKRVEHGVLTPALPGVRAQSMALVECMEHFHVPAVSVAVINDYRLEWARGYGQHVTVSATGAGLSVRLSGQEAIAFFPASETTYCSSAVDSELTFALDDGGAVIGLTIRQNGKDLPAKKEQ